MTNFYKVEVEYVESFPREGDSHYRNASYVGGVGVAMCRSLKAAKRIARERALADMLAVTLAREEAGTLPVGTHRYGGCCVLDEIAIDGVWQFND